MRDTFFQVAIIFSTLIIVTKNCKKNLLGSLLESADVLSFRFLIRALDCGKLREFHEYVYMSIEGFLEKKIVRLLDFTKVRSSIVNSIGSAKILVFLASLEANLNLVFVFSHQPIYVA